MTARSTTTMANSAWTDAVSMYKHLAGGGRLAPLTNSPVPFHLRYTDEQPLFAISGRMTFERYRGTDVNYCGGGSVLIVGGPVPPAVAGLAMGSWVANWRGRRRARRMSEPQWRPTPLGHVVLTTRRLRCEVLTSTGPEWMYFDYDYVTHLQLAGSMLILSFRDSEPLRLTGEAAPLCAAVLAHTCPQAMKTIPDLQGAAMT